VHPHPVTSGQQHACDGQAAHTGTDDDDVHVHSSPENLRSDLGLPSASTSQLIDRLAKGLIALDMVTRVAEVYRSATTELRAGAT
jgi:hypothetical protein